MFDAVRFWSRSPAASEGKTKSSPCPPHLHERMRQAHAAVADGFRQARDSHRQGEPEACANHLRTFERCLRSYLDTEQAQFEEYLLQRLEGEHGRALVVRQVRARLRQLAREAREMLRPTGSGMLSAAQGIDHTFTFDIMSTILSECIEATEDLMPYCLPSAGGEAVASTNDGAANESAAWSKVAWR